MGLFARGDEFLHDVIREERRYDETLVPAWAEWRGGSAIQPGNPEAAFVLIEAFWPGEPHAAQFVGDLRHALPTLRREGTKGQTR